MSITPELLASVKVHEGYRARAYQDSVKVWTIGYGTNLQELEIDEELATEWLYDKLRKAEVSARGYPWFPGLGAARRDVIVEMIYNLGLPRFAKFGKMIAALAVGHFETAAREMIDSTWATQVGLRADRLAQQMLDGEYWRE